MAVAALASSAAGSAAPSSARRPGASASATIRNISFFMSRPPAKGRPIGGRAS
jgi:hypothetical protein